MTVDVNVIDRASESQTQFGELDTSSIMMYWQDPQWTTNDPPLEIPSNTELSDADKEFMLSIYPKNQISEPVDHPNGMSLKSAMAGSF
eukprot:TRINITY_DN15086_c0_g1_i1.p3 TRINITY_DN15086_c0_g1~~TRINITY_DN15086_c0_g1_i1.p3  ORF type:complete len:88 (+),score=9.17 TRINITY_DN15086_c0_g1_i1:62-325(+)